MAINGATMPGLVSMSVSRNNFLAADTYTATVALDAFPASTNLPNWAQSNIIELNLMAAPDGGAASSVIIGLVDAITIDPALLTMTLAGRDYTAVFIETKTAEKFLNLTSSQVAAMLAARHGLQARVSITTTPTGKFYDDDHAEVTNEVSEWSLLTFLAQREGFDIFLEGRVLVFQPAVDRAQVTPFPVRCVAGAGGSTANVARLDLRRNLTLAGDVVVKVISWSHEAKAPVTSVRKAEKVNRLRIAGSGTPPTYVFRETGLTQAQADAFATAKLQEIIMHERQIDFDMPADLSLTPRSVIRLSGSGTDFDQDYLVGQIDLSCSAAGGFPMRVSARSASPYSVVTL